MFLRQLLYRCEPRFLSVISSYWLNLQSVPNYEELIRMLCNRMTDKAVLRKKLNEEDAKSLHYPLRFLINNGNIDPAEDFESFFGDFRIAGTDKIFREKMWKNPISLTEKLWYQGLIFREIREIDNEMKDCYILPEDVSKILAEIIHTDAALPVQPKQLAVRPAIPSETAYPVPQDISLQDNLCLTLALKRDHRTLDLLGLNAPEAYMRFLNMFLSEGIFFNKDKSADTESIRKFLTQNRTASRIQMIHIWRNAAFYDEICECPEITVVSSPEYNKKRSRESLLSLLVQLPQDSWVSVNSFLAIVKKTDPQFLRSSFTDRHGLLQDRDGNDLNGIGAWFQLEGAYLRFMIRGPLNWLGIIQCAYPDKNMLDVSAFRISKEALFYLSESSGAEINKAILAKPNLEQALPTISGDGAVSCSVKVPRYFRYMTARFAELEKVRSDSVVFRITPASLSHAEGCGLSRSTLLQLLRRFSKNKVPPTLEHMLSTKENTAKTAIIYSALILTIPDKNVLTELLEAPRLEKWIYQQINSSSVLVDKKGITEIRRFLMEREIFVDVQLKEK